VKKQSSESFVQTIIGDEGVRRACADFVIAVVGTFTGKRGSVTTPED
jgi:hypothetical protein